MIAEKNRNYKSISFIINVNIIKQILVNKTGKYMIYSP